MKNKVIGHWNGSPIKTYRTGVSPEGSEKVEAKGTGGLWDLKSFGKGLVVRMSLFSPKTDPFVSPTSDGLVRPSSDGLSVTVIGIIQCLAGRRGRVS